MSFINSTLIPLKKLFNNVYCEVFLPYWHKATAFILILFLIVYIYKEESALFLLRKVIFYILEFQLKNEVVWFLINLE